MQFSERNRNLSTTDNEIIFHAQKSLLYNKGAIWVKKKSHHGAEVSELVGTYMLSIISQNYNNKNYLQNIFKKQLLDIATQ